MCNLICTAPDSHQFKFYVTLVDAQTILDCLTRPNQAHMSHPRIKANAKGDILLYSPTFGQLGTYHITLHDNH